MMAAFAMTFSAEFRQLVLPLVWDYSDKLSDFVVNESNNYAFEWLAKWPDHINGNFVCLVGEKGSGKTHLANVWAKRLNASVMSATSDIFAMWYEISSPDSDQMYFVLEDIDRIDDELLLFYIYNTILEKNAHLLMTTRTHPLRLGLSLQDLKSRMATVNFVSIERPSDEVVVKIMSSSLMRRGINIPEDCSEYIVKRIERSYESINYWVDKIDCTVGNCRKVTLPFIRDLIKGQ
jgi:chromosomal replication initiation ATPase DnaA